MPQASMEYAVGCISVLSTKMLNAARLRRIAEAPTLDDALTLLLETGYGGNLSNDQVDNNEIDYVIRAQLHLSRREVWDITPEPDLTSLFFLEFDGHNIKALLKARLLGIDAADVLMDCGSIPLEVLKESIRTQSYEKLSESYRMTMEQIEEDLTKEIDPLMFSAMVDGAMFKRAKAILTAHGNKGFVWEYFSLMADFQNARSVVRARLLNWDASKLKPLLLECGEVPFNVFMEAMDVPLEQLGAKLNKGPYGKIIAQAIDDYVSSKDIGILKKEMEAALMRIVRNAKNERFSLGPLIAYFMARESEAEALRIIFNAKRNGTEVDLPELFS